MDPLPNEHDGVYSLDVIGRLRGEDEHAYITNLTKSLEDDGVLIIGTPSAESQIHSSLQGKTTAYHNYRNGLELRALMERYFDRVFIFSMNDEVVHSGFHPMAHYFFAVCTGAKSDDRSDLP